MSLLAIQMSLHLGPCRCQISTGATATTTRDIRVRLYYYANHAYTAFGVTSANSAAAPQSYSGSLLYNPFTIYSPVFRAGTGFLNQNLSFGMSQNKNAQASLMYLYGGYKSNSSK